MMMYYRFPILFAICIICLGFARNQSDSSQTALALVNNPENSVSNKFLAQSLTIEQKNKSASSADNSNYDRHMQAGYEAFDRKDYKTALDNFSKALAERPDNLYARQAAQNAETQLQLLEERTNNNNSPSNLWWMALGLGLLFAVCGGVFFLSGWTRKSASLEQEELADEDIDPSVAKNNQEYRNKYEFPALAPGTSQENNANNSTTKQEKDNVPLQTTTRLPSVDAIDELVKDLQEPDPKKRRKAIWELAQKGDSRAMKPLVDLTIDSDSQERSLILEALSQISIRTLKPMNQALAISLQDKNPQVRKNAIRDLTRIYDLMSQISQMLRHALDDSDSDVQETAKWALDQLNLQMTPTQLDLISIQKNDS
jgi:hypothetical protein